MTILHPTRLVRFNLLAIILGASIPFAAESLIEDYTTARLVATIAFFINSLNFFHGKVVTLEDEDYNMALINRPILALNDFFLNTMVILSFVFMAFSLNDPFHLIKANIAVRVLDSILVFMVRDISSNNVVRKAQFSWLFINICCILLFIITYITISHINIIKHKNTIALIIANLYLLLILTDISIDYTVNRKLYFSIGQTWDDIAEFWNALHGRYGDLYRRAIIIPNLLQYMSNLNQKRILDLGCGNGCIARIMAMHGGEVIAVDKSNAMLTTAKRYKQNGVVYKQCDIDISTQTIDQGSFDYIVACFSLQDCNSLKNAFQLIANNLDDKGLALIIFENDYALSHEYTHITTQRKWIDADKIAGNGRRQLIFWDPEKVILSQDCIPPIDDEVEYKRQFPNRFTTVTRHWFTEVYLRNAHEAGLQLYSIPYDLQVINNDEKSIILHRYQRQPHFRMLVLAKKDKIINRTDNYIIKNNSLPVILLGGVTGSGKTTVTSYLQDSSIVISMDDFYMSVDDPRLPTKNDKPDWESPKAIDMDALEKAIENLIVKKQTYVPTYDMLTSKPTESKLIDPSNASIVIVEGLFAFNLFIAKTPYISRVLLTPPSLLGIIKQTVKYIVGKISRQQDVSSIIAPLFIRRIYRDIKEKRRRTLVALVNALSLSLKDKKYHTMENKLADLVIKGDASPEKIAQEIKRHIFKISNITA